MNVHVYEYINICKQLYMSPTSFMVKVLQTNAIIFTKCTGLQIKNRVNYILIMASFTFVNFASIFICIKDSLFKKHIKTVN